MGETEPPLITAKGELNQGPWTKWYLSEKGGAYLTAHNEFCERVANMAEPSLTTPSGKPSPVWQKWYRMRKKVSSNIALNTCKQRIKAAAEGKELPKEHKVVWW